MVKLLRLENIESCWDFMKDRSIQNFVQLFCNETLSRVYRLIIFSSDLEQDHMFLKDVRNAIDFEAKKRKIDCFQPIKQNRYIVKDVIYHQKEIIYYSD